MSADLLARGLGARAQAAGAQTARGLAIRGAAAAPLGPLPAFTVLSTPPVVTVTDATATGIAGAVRVPATSGSFRRTGTPVVPIAADPTLYGASDGAGGTAFGAFVQWEWMSDAGQLELLVLKYNSVFDLFVDGQPVQASAFATPATGDRRLIRLDWTGDADPHRPRHYRLAGTNLLFGGLYLDAAGSAWAPGDRAGAGLIAVLGDSYTQGTGALSAARNWVAAAAAQLRMEGWSDGIGGSGWNSAGGNAPAARIGRGIAVLTRAPDLIVTALGYNDAAADAAGLQRLRTSYDATVAAIRAAWPGVRLVSLGPWTPLGATGGLANVRAAIADRAAAAGVGFVDLEGMIGAGNRARYTGSDSVHPTPQGHVYLGRRIAQAIAAMPG